MTFQIRFTRAPSPSLRRVPVSRGLSKYSRTFEVFVDVLFLLTSKCWSNTLITASYIVKTDVLCSRLLLGLMLVRLFMHGHMSLMLFSSSTRPFGQDFIASGESGLFLHPLSSKKHTDWMLELETHLRCVIILASTRNEHTDERSGWDFVVTLSNLINVSVVPNSPSGHISAPATPVLRERAKGRIRAGV